MVSLQGDMLFVSRDRIVGAWRLELGNVVKGDVRERRKDVKRG